MSLLFNYWTSITEFESPSKNFDWKIYLYSFRKRFNLSIHEEKPPHKVKAVFFINTISSHEGQLGRLGCMGCDGV